MKELKRVTTRLKQIAPRVVLIPLSDELTGFFYKQESYSGVFILPRSEFFVKVNAPLEVCTKALHKEVSAYPNGATAKISNEAKSIILSSKTSYETSCLVFEAKPNFNFKAVQNLLSLDYVEAPWMSKSICLSRLAEDDPIRPMIGCVHFSYDGVFAGNEVHFGKYGTNGVNLDESIRAECFSKLDLKAAYKVSYDTSDYLLVKESDTHIRVCHFVEGMPPKFPSISKEHHTPIKVDFDKLEELFKGTKKATRDFFTIEGQSNSTALMYNGQDVVDLEVLCDINTQVSVSAESVFDICRFYKKFKPGYLKFLVRGTQHPIILSYEGIDEVIYPVVFS